MVTSGPIMYLIMEDQVLSRCRTTQPPASEFEDAEPLTGMIGSHCGPPVVCMGPGTDRLLGMTSGSHMKDQVTDQIGG
jgi:hypothetical protein